MRTATPRAGVLAAVAVGLLAAVVAPAHAGLTSRQGLEGVPSFHHVFVIVLENEDFATT